MMDPARGVATQEATNTQWLIACAALAGFAIDALAYWPGQMSFDSAYAWWQARGGTTTNIVPPVFVWLWRACDALIEGPGLMFALQLALFWGGLALIAHAVRLHALACIGAFVLIAFAPVPWLLRGHVWTDVGLFCALTFACGALAICERNGRRRWLLPAALALGYAALLRHNALPAVLPLIAWAAWLGCTRERRADPRRIPQMAGTIALACIVLIGAQGLLARGVDRQVPLWPSLAQFDLAAISVATGTVLLPEFMIGANLDTADLGQAFRSWSNTPMLVNTRHGMRDPFAEDFTPDQLQRLRAAWFGAITRHPDAWFAHRWRLSRALFGTHAREWPVELQYVDAQIAYGDNPAVAPNTGMAHVALMRMAAAARERGLLAAWPYLLIGLAALPLAWRHRRRLEARLALICVASAWLYALPLTLLAPSAELRYLGWPCVASLLALACALLARHAAAAARLHASSFESHP